MAVRREQDFFWEGVDRGEFLAQKCAHCSSLRHPPLPRCPHCGSPDWNPHSLSGRGRIVSWVRLAHPSGKDGTSRIGILVELEEGLRFVSNLVDEENAAIDAPVEHEFGTVGEERLVLFHTVPAKA